MKSLKDKVIWITGASSGFGEALAYEFARQGAKLILSARRMDELQKVSASIEHAAIVPLDLSTREEFEKKTQDALQSFGHIDMIVHCAGIAQNGSALETTVEVQRKIMDVDFFSYTELTRCLLPHFISRKSGHIVIVSGVLAKVGMPGRSSYCAAKAALHGYFDSLRAEMINHNIKVTILVPGFLQTSLTQKALNAQGEISGKTPDNAGCPVDKAATQAIKAICKEKFETYIGNNDKGKMLLRISRWFPSLAIKMVLKNVKKG